MKYSKKWQNFEIADSKWMKGKSNRNGIEFEVTISKAELV